MNTSTEMNTL